MAGEIKEAHPSIEVTLVASDEALLTRTSLPYSHMQSAPFSGRAHPD